MSTLVCTSLSIMNSIGLHVKHQRRGDHFGQWKIVRHPILRDVVTGWVNKNVKTRGASNSGRKSVSKEGGVTDVREKVARKKKKSYSKNKQINTEAKSRLGRQTGVKISR